MIWNVDHFLLVGVQSEHVHRLLAKKQSSQQMIFLHLLEPVLVHCARSNTGFESVEDGSDIHQLPLCQTVRMAGQ